MRTFRGVMLLAVLVSLFAAPAARAHDGQNGPGARVVVPANRIHGETGGALLGEWYARILPIPDAQNPFDNGPPQCVRIGHKGRVIAPAGSGNTCTVTPRDRILINAAS